MTFVFQLLKQTIFTFQKLRTAETKASTQEDFYLLLQQKFLGAYELQIKKNELGDLFLTWKQKGKKARSDSYSLIFSNEPSSVFLNYHVDEQIHTISSLPCAEFAVECYNISLQKKERNACFDAKPPQAILLHLDQDVFPVILSQDCLVISYSKEEDV